MCEREVARAERIEIAQDRERVFDGVAAFDADHDRGLAVLFRLANAGRVVAEREDVGIPAHFIVNEIDDAIRESRGAAAGVKRRHVRGEERGGDAALVQRFQIELRLGIVLADVQVVADQAVGRVAMPVDDDGAAVDGRDAGQRRLIHC